MVDHNALRENVAASEFFTSTLFDHDALYEIVAFMDDMCGCTFLCFWFQSRFNAHRFHIFFLNDCVLMNDCVSFNYV